MLDLKITELADRIIRHAFLDRTKQLQHDILLTQNDAAMRGLGTSSALVELVYNHCANDVRIRAGIVCNTLKTLVAENGSTSSETLREDLMSEVLKYQETICLDASLSLDTVAKNAGFPTKTLSGALEHALAGVQNEIDLFLIARNRIGELSSDKTEKPISTRQQSPQYVELSRIEELRGLAPRGFDLSKLVKMCEELNLCFSIECYFAVAMLVRAILDHVPPIFGYKSFSEFACNYAGAKSFKQSMANLENSSRKIADHHLHVQIRKSETLPNRTQVNFSNDVDVLLSEIVRILQK